MSQLEKMPEDVIPTSVKIAMKDGYDNYNELSDEEYKHIADFFNNQLI